MRIKSVTAILALLVVLSCLNSCSEKTYSVISSYDGGDCYLDYDSDEGCVRNYVPYMDEIYEIYVNDDGAIVSARLLESGYVFPIFDVKTKGYPITTYGKGGRTESIEYPNLLINFLYDGNDDSITGISYCSRSFSDDWDYDNMKTKSYKTNPEDHYIETTDSRFRLFNDEVWIWMIEVLHKIH